MNNVVKYGIGLLALGVSVYVIGIAWRRSQKKNNGMADFAGVGGPGDSRLPKGKAQCMCNFVRQDCPCPPKNS